MKTHRFSMLFLSAMLLVPAATGLAQGDVRDALSVQEQSIRTSGDVQKRIDALDDATREALNEYRQTMAQVQDLAAYNEQLQRLVATQRVEMADYERQFNEI